MRRMLLVLSVALVLAAVMVTSAMPAFAQGRGEGAQGEAVGPEGGNPGIGLFLQAGRTVGANDLQPLPFGGQDPEVLPGKPGSTEEGKGSEKGLENAPGGVVCTAPGSPFFAPELEICP
jgi:hypothetical protein